MVVVCLRPHAWTRCLKVAQQTGRLASNVGHQGEELTYRLVNSALSKSGTIVWWPWPALRWSAEMLNATGVAAFFGPKQPEACAAFDVVRPVVKRAQWSAGRQHASARAAAYAACGVAPGVGGALVRVLGRDDDLRSRPVLRRLDVCGGGELRRSLRNVEGLRSATLRAARRAGVAASFDVVNVSASNPGTFCEQIRRFQVDVLVSVHGAHLVNVPFMRPESLLVEVLPWAHTNKQHHARLLRHTDVDYAKLCGPKPDDKRLTMSEEACEGRSDAARRCTAIVRDCHPTLLRDETTDPGHCRRPHRPCDCLASFEALLWRRWSA